MIPLRSIPWLVLLALVSLGCGTLPESSVNSTVGPWNVRSLERLPAREWGARTGLVQEVHYAGEPLNGKPTRVFAYLGRPDPAVFGSGRHPGMVLVHGGGGKAFKDWAEHWAKRGYVALAMDLAGKGPDGKRLTDGGPDQDDKVKFREFTTADMRDMWTYHAVSAVVLGHSLLRSLPEVDASRTGVTGISWGGYLTCIVAGVDARFRVAVPVYGCGFLGDNSVWTDKSLASMTPESRALWLREFDPSQYLGKVRCPILFLNGTTDFAYPMDSYQKSYRLVPERFRHVSVNIDLPHGHIWTFGEVDAFVDSRLRGGKDVPSVGVTTVAGHQVKATWNGPVGLKEAKLCYTTDVGPWQKRSWKFVPARVEGRGLEAELPLGRPLVAFLSVTDERGLRVSGEHFELPVN